MKNNIVLCGFMGCGKSTVARVLSKMTGYKALDSDKAVEQKEGITVKEIFELHGEEYFRRSEADTVKELSRKKNIIIATGGGAVLRPENAEALRQTGFVVFLDISPADVLSRLEGDTTRPLLNRPDKEYAVNELLNKRRPIYAAAADLTVDAGQSPNEVAKKILSAYRNSRSKS